MSVPENRHVLISVNPKAGRSSPALRAERLRDALVARGFDVELSTDLPALCQKANELHAAGRLRCLVGVGGDGTAAELVNRTDRGTPVSLLPAGTANLLAKHYRLPSRPEKLARVIEAGKTITIDGGLANGRLFIVMVGVGFDADVVRQVHRAREESYRAGQKRGAHISYFSYIKPICRSIASYSFPQVRVELTDGDNTSETLDAHRWAFIFNLNRYGWGLPMVPAARGDDGKLDHCLFRGGSVPHGFWYTAWVQCFAAHRILSSVSLGQSPRYRITSDSDDVPYQLDGDPGGVLPVEIETLPKRITLLVP
ncbi:MAG: diacylglycerol/lipid kinase family protein [Thermoguttaceae bacterium]